MENDNINQQTINIRRIFRKSLRKRAKHQNIPTKLRQRNTNRQRGLHSPNWWPCGGVSRSIWSILNKTGFVSWPRRSRAVDIGRGRSIPVEAGRGRSRWVDETTFLGLSLCLSVSTCFDAISFVFIGIYMISVMFHCLLLFE
jgi:hypothetical protein